MNPLSMGNCSPGVARITGYPALFLTGTSVSPSASTPASGVEALGLTEVPVRNSAGYPVILATPGEQFPIERGFIYLVKEKRPAIAFEMFNEATIHGAKGMLVVREHPNRLKPRHEV